MGLAEKIRAIRKAAGLNQAEFAARLGISQSQVSKWEKIVGAETPSLENIQKIADFSEIPVDLLLSLTDQAVGLRLVAKATADDLIVALPPGIKQRIVALPQIVPSAAVAAEIEGDVFGPTFAGWTLVYDDIRLPPSADLCGKLCIVWLADNRVMVKIIEPGQLIGRFNLFSLTGAPVYDADVSWVSPIRCLSQRG